ncbi:NAD-P-binding protein [Trametes punicea]|nr:NAD-P-binding protein [Trametes punicea]
MDALTRAVALMKAAVGTHPFIISVAVIILCHKLLRRPRQQRRSRILPQTSERVLILGASSGIGRAIAHEYAARGSRVCIVGRREQQLAKVAEECANLSPHQAAGDPSERSSAVLHVKADFSNVEDMVALQDKLEKEWGGLDTLIVSAGVSALRPLLEVAGIERRDGVFHPSHASVEGVSHAVSVATAAMQANYIGPLVCAITFIPVLSSTSPSPSVLLISSLAAVIPAPTRSLYASSKSASLLLYQSLAIEHPNIAFSYVLPSTVQGDFRASAVDGGFVREAEPNKQGLKVETVAKRCLEAIDRRERAVFTTAAEGRIGHFMYWLFPTVVERVAAKKYNYTAN